MILGVYVAAFIPKRTRPEAVRILLRAPPFLQNCHRKDRGKGVKKIISN